MSEIERIYTKEQPCIFSYCLNRVSNWHVAEDLTSATFERALSLLPHPNAHALLLSIARHKVLTYWTMERKRKTWTFADVFKLPEERYPVLATDPIESVVDACDTAMAAAFVRAALAECNDQDLRIIELRYVRRLPAKECAAAFGLTPLQYNKRHNGLLHRLAQRLDMQPSDKPQPQCLVCEGALYGRGLCHYHYQQAREGKRIPMLPPKVEQRPISCQECGAPHYSRGYCRKHYQEQRTIERRQERHSVRSLL